MENDKIAEIEPSVQLHQQLKLKPYIRIAIFKNMADLRVLLAVLKKKIRLEQSFQLESEGPADDPIYSFHVPGIGRIYTVLVFNKSAGRHKAKQVFDIVKKNENQTAIVYIHHHALGLFKASVTGRFPTICFESHEEFVSYFSSDLSFIDVSEIDKEGDAYHAGLELYNKTLERDMREIKYHLAQQQKFFAEGGIWTPQEIVKRKKAKKNKKNVSGDNDVRRIKVKKEIESVSTDANGEREEAQEKMVDDLLASSGSLN